MAECPRRDANLKECNCSYAGCGKKGTCCECMHSHRKRGELPGCFFPNDVEATYDRSVARFVALHAG